MAEKKSFDASHIKTNPLSKKLAKILDNQLENDKVYDAMKGFAIF